MTETCSVSLNNESFLYVTLINGIRALSFLTVHARTPDMRNEPIDLENLKFVKSCIQLPVVANGNVRSLNDAEVLYRESKCNGVMVASGILTNPALFAGYAATPTECIQDWLDITSIMDIQFLSMHHHLVFMLEKVLTKKEKLIFNVLNNKNDIYAFLKDRFNIEPKTISDKYKVTDCEYQIKPRKFIKQKNIEDDCNIDLENLFIQ
ncbi:tRNA-dihydrouridine(20a/20b) synthase [NAD(P)+]-like [Phymastichus coffea]|uniref:tRNA-dihydrouridine(20a/20b) synthase [NAD(P)+]-like n=1 Tax=Phymastichus coffea TaxID=108790 RepID=UPI00273AA12C|nr:tRNA-dihydrouridine(20a/20b) synthase [NAD(P)+]-like [Phymastichus coffea]